MIGNDWDIILKDEFEKDYFKKLIDFIKKEYYEKTIYPKQTDFRSGRTNIPLTDIGI